MDQNTTLGLVKGLDFRLNSHKQGNYMSDVFLKYHFGHCVEKGVGRGSVDGRNRRFKW